MIMGYLITGLFTLWRVSPNRAKFGTGMFLLNSMARCLNYTDTKQYII